MQTLITCPSYYYDLNRPRRTPSCLTLLKKQQHYANKTLDIGKVLNRCAQKFIHFLFALRTGCQQLDILLVLAAAGMVHNKQLGLFCLGFSSSKRGLCLPECSKQNSIE